MEKIRRTMEATAASRLDALFASIVKHFAPPEDISVSEWADKYRVLSTENAAEAGQWRTARTPYLEEPMRAFTDPRVSNIVMVAASQVGKTEFMLNCIGYAIDQDPASTMLILPTVDDGRKFSRLRIATMIRDCKRLREKVSEVKARDSANTMLQKSFPGGMLTITGSNSASALASIPARYIFGDERDRWAISAGTEGDPWGLAQARQATFYNRKAVEVSTPTVKGRSNIADSYARGTQERWCHQCPECGEWHEIRFDHIKFEFTTKVVNGKKEYTVTSLHWVCPGCGSLVTEARMRGQPARWIAGNPDAVESGVRSFWLTAFASPWMPWKTIVLRFLESRNDPLKLQVVFNTLLGELWEDRGELADEETMLARREEYDAELPEGVLALTCGVDTQDNRLEYEVVGHGKFDETWGIHRGFIMGEPSSAEVWQKLDAVIDHVYTFKNGKGLRILCTCVDSGGHYTQDVYEACRARLNKRVVAIKGKGGQDVPFIQPPTQVAIRDNKRIKCWLYTIGVDAGKSRIMSRLKVQEKGAGYTHFPRGDQGYDAAFFAGLLSEKMVLTRTSRGDVWRWEKLPGHRRNEALDCRNYALAAMQIASPDLDAVERRLRGLDEPQRAAAVMQQAPKQPSRVQRNRLLDGDEW